MPDIHYASFVTPTKQKQRQAVRKAAKVAPGINTPDTDGWTPLMRACVNGSLKVVQDMIAAGADVDKTDPEGFGPMECACANGRTEFVRFLLANGAGVDRPDTWKRTPLHWTVTKGDFVETAEVLISAGADINRADAGGFTPLMRAALTNHPRCFKLLLDTGADFSRVNDEWHKSAIEMAIERGSEEVREIAKTVVAGQGRSR